MTTKMKLLIGFGVYILGCIVIVVATGFTVARRTREWVAVPLE